MQNRQGEKRKGGKKITRILKPGSHKFAFERKESQQKLKSLGCGNSNMEEKYEYGVNMRRTCWKRQSQTA